MTSCLLLPRRIPRARLERPPRGTAVVEEGEAHGEEHVGGRLVVAEHRSPRHAPRLGGGGAGPADEAVVEGT